MNWQKKRYGTELHQEWIRFGSGVVQSISTFVQILTQPGDSVMILQPVYNPFAEVVKNTGRRLVVSELKNANEVYSLDLADMERKIDEENVKLLIFCSPHNPVGRVWSAEELEEMLELCRNKQVRVIFDEIHHDLIVGKNRSCPDFQSETVIIATISSCLIRLQKHSTWRPLTTVT